MIKRYDHGVAHGDSQIPESFMCVSDKGAYVDYEDYAALQQKLDAMGPIIQPHDLKALLRFNETSEDGEGYDIGSESMSRLVELGLASKGPHGIRSITPFGRWVVERSEGEISDNTLKTEDDINSDFAVKIAKLRSGTHDTADEAG